MKGPISFILLRLYTHLSLAAPVSSFLPSFLRSFSRTAICCRARSRVFPNVAGANGISAARSELLPPRRRRRRHHLRCEHPSRVARLSSAVPRLNPKDNALRVVLSTMFNHVLRPYNDATRSSLRTN
ncbi:hypothetical protein PUN28_019033 [Cardiocondyla obscurior]|uniref:Secreted protein n=1 Tax=Cardiocondyla obscurior TaxID=286306 RepID=A0AAW2ED40_9HYME